MTKTIQLTRGKVAIVDDIDFEHLSQFSWTAKPAQQLKSNWYAVRFEGRKTIYMHREISTALLGEETDHKDGNGLNNTRENLRNCTRTLNTANQRYSIPKSGYRGVYWQKRNKSWQAQATRNNKTINLGNFLDPAEAAKVRDRYVYGLYGQFAVLNFPNEATP